MSYGYSRMKKLKKRASYRYQYMPNLNEMEFKDYHQKGTLYNSMLEPLEFRVGSQILSRE